MVFLVAKKTNKARTRWTHSEVYIWKDCLNQSESFKFPINLIKGLHTIWDIPGFKQVVQYDLGSGVWEKVEMKWIFAIEQDTFD